MLPLWKLLKTNGIYYSAELSRTLVSQSTQSLSESVNALSDTTCATLILHKGFDHDHTFPRLLKCHTGGYFINFAFTSYSSRCCIWVGDIGAETWQMPHCTEQPASQIQLCNLLLSTLRTDVLKVYSVIFFFAH